MEKLADFGLVAGVAAFTSVCLFKVVRVLVFNVL